MAADLRFKRIQSTQAPILHWQFEGKTLSAHEGDTVAVALLANGIDFTRITPVRGTKRAPFCMMGTCFDCLMEIDEQANQQACQVRLRPGMVVKRMIGAREVKQ